MATKYQFINDMYEHTLSNLTENQSSWFAFLKSACRNYKCRFDEQVLIYAQRPDATAVLESEKWNTQFGRWVNKGAKGIAVFHEESRDSKWLRHYFDISDTHGNSTSRSVPIWSIATDHQPEIIESLENSFGDIEDKSTLATALFATARNVVEDNISDYLHDLMNSVDESALDGMSEAEVEKRFRAVVTMSVEYMLFNRCELDTEFFSQVELGYFSEFNTLQTVNALGLASSDISEMVLRDISATINNIRKREQKQNRTFANPEIIPHNEPIPTKTERSADNGTDISTSGRRNDTQSRSEDRAVSSPWQIRISKEKVSDGKPQAPTPEPVDDRNTQQPSIRDRADSQREDGNDNQSDGSIGERDGGTESARPDEMGRTDEQHQSISGGNDTERTDLQLEILPTAAEQMSLVQEAEEEKPSAFSVSQQIIDEVLTSGSNERKSTLRIAAFFKKDHVPMLNADFLKREYGTDGKGFIFDGGKVSVWFDNSGIRIAHGETVRTADATIITWEQAAKRIRELLDMGRYMPQSELDKVDDDEYSNLANCIKSLYHDRADDVEFPFIDKEILSKGYPEATERIAKLLKDPLERQKTYDGLTEFASAVEQDSSLLRFPSAQRQLNQALDYLEDLQREPLNFVASDTVTSAEPSFITQDEIEKLFIRGSNTEGGKFRIYSHFLQNKTAKEKADFLRSEYGTGGFGRTGINESHDSKGIVFSRGDIFTPYDKVLLTWSHVANRIDKLIAENRYMSKAELDYIPEYEKGILAREIYHFYTDQPEEVMRPYERA